MFYNREGLPKEGEILICKVNKIQYHSVFVNIEEYKGKSGMIHISEISPGRIRNIRDYVKEGKIIVCKVLKVHKERGYIDLSLRRVNEGQRREKINLMKQEQKAEKIIEFVANNLNIDKKKLYEQVWNQINKDYEYIHDYFEDIVLGNAGFDIKLDKKVKEELRKAIFERIRPPEIELKAQITINSYEPDGVAIIKDFFIKLDKECHDIKASYLGGGNYGISIKDEDYKSAESRLKLVKELAEKHFKKTDSYFSLEKVEA